MPSAIPPVSQVFVKHASWQIAVEKRWRWPEEHIGMKEGRVVVSGIRRAARAGLCDCHALFLCDNMSCVLAHEKGRGKQWSLNSLCQRSLAYTQSLNIRPQFRYIESERNVADEGSRRYCSARKFQRPSHDSDVLLEQSLPHACETCRPPGLDLDIACLHH